MTANPQEILDTPQVLYMAIELSSNQWKLGFTTSLGRRPRIRNVVAGSLADLEFEIENAKKHVGLSPDALVISCYEAGRDAFWLHRCLVSLGVQNHIVEPASIQVNRRKRNAKTDRIDCHKIVNALIRWKSGDQYACRMIRVPDKDHEDARHLNREMRAIKKERTVHVNRIKGLLVAQGCQFEINPNFPTHLQHAVGGDGKPLGQRLVQRLGREFDRLVLATEQIRALQQEQMAMIRKARLAVAESSTDANHLNRVTKLAEHLTNLRGIGAVTAWTLSAEIFSWRDIANRRQLAAFVGLVPTPHASGNDEKEQGISKSGRSDLRVLLIEIAWLWLRYQPESDLTRWYNDRFAEGTSRQRKIGIVALARKLLVALGKYVRHGEVPGGAEISVSLTTSYFPSLVPKATRTQATTA